jgi:hypothetical protein
MNNKSFLYILTLTVVILAALNVKQHYELDEMRRFIEELNNRYDKLLYEYDELMDEHETLLFMINLTHTGANIKISHSLSFFKISEREFSSNFFAMIYNPRENSTLKLYLYDVFPENKISVPLCVQKGYATKGEEATETWDKSHKFAPIIWSLNPTGRGSYLVPLPSKGWYTVSIMGPIIKGAGSWEVAGPFPVIEGTVRAHLLITITYDGRSIPFAVLGPFL